jgi:hypothetical protein
MARSELGARGLFGQTGGQDRAVREHPEWWSVVRRCHRARLSYPGGPGFRHLIVEYRTTGATLTIELPLAESSCGDLDERLVDLEILDEYLSMSVGHVQLTGRAEITTPQPQRTVSTAPLWAVAARSRTTIVFTPVCVDGGE